MSCYICFCLFSLCFLVLPESAGRVQGAAEGSTRRLWRQIGRQGWNCFGVVTRVISKLDSNWLSGALWNSAIQLLNSSLRLNALIKSDEPDTLG